MLFSVFVTLWLFRAGAEGFGVSTKRVKATKIKVSKIRATKRVKLVFAVLVCLVFVEEFLLNSVYATYGFAFSILGLILLPFLAVVLGRSDDWLRISLEVVALIFASRVVLSPFPYGFLSLPVFLPTIYTLILAGLVLYLTYRKVSARDVRLSKGRLGVGVQLAAGLTVGTVIGFIEYFVLRPQPVLAGASLLQMLAYIMIVLGVMVGVVEETLFRGLLQSSLEKAIPGWQAIGVSSVMFGLMHVGWMNPLEVLLGYGAGVVFGYLAMVTDSLIAPITAHNFGNVVLYLIALNLP